MALHEVVVGRFANKMRARQQEDHRPLSLLLWNAGVVAGQRQHHARPRAVLHPAGPGGIEMGGDNEVRGALAGKDGVDVDRFPSIPGDGCLQRQVHLQRSFSQPFSNHVPVFFADVEAGHRADLAVVRGVIRECPHIGVAFQDIHRTGGSGLLDVAVNIFEVEKPSNRVRLVVAGCRILRVVGHEGEQLQHVPPHVHGRQRHQHHLPLDLSRCYLFLRPSAQVDQLGGDTPGRGLAAVGPEVALYLRRLFSAGFQDQPPPLLLPVVEACLLHVHIQAELLQLRLHVGSGVVICRGTGQAWAKAINILDIAVYLGFSRYDHAFSKITRRRPGNSAN